MRSSSSSSWIPVAASSAVQLLDLGSGVSRCLPQAATSGPFGAAPARIASPICLDAALRSALSRSDSPSSSRRLPSRVSAASTIEGSSPLSIAPCRIRSGSSRSLASPMLMR